MHTNCCIGIWGIYQPLRNGKRPVLGVYMHGICPDEGKLRGSVRTYRPVGTWINTTYAYDIQRIAGNFILQEQYVITIEKGNNVNCVGNCQNRWNGGRIPSDKHIM